MCVLVNYLKAYERVSLDNTNTSGVNFHHIPLNNTHQQSKNNQQQPTIQQPSSFPTIIQHFIILHHTPATISMFMDLTSTKQYKFNFTGFFVS